MSWKKERGIIARESSSQKNTQRELEEAQKQGEEQRELTKYWKEQTKELRGKMVGERQVWENKYKTDMEKQF